MKSSGWVAFPPSHPHFKLQAFRSKLKIDKKYPSFSYIQSGDWRRVINVMLDEGWRIDLNMLSLLAIPYIKTARRVARQKQQESIVTIVVTVQEVKWKKSKKN